MQERRQHNEQMAADIGYIKGMLEGLCGPTGRVTKLEKAQERQWWMTYVVTPTLLILHGIARQLGVKI